MRRGYSSSKPATSLRQPTAFMRGGLRPTKDEAECCNEKRDDLGRLPIGYCGPDCLRRPK